MALSDKQFIAKLISGIPDCETRLLVGEKIADFCREESPFFDDTKFYSAAGLDECAKTGECEPGPEAEQTEGLSQGGEYAV